jgi:hypothetical protein
MNLLRHIMSNPMHLVIMGCGDAGADGGRDNDALNGKPAVTRSTYGSGRLNC